MVFNIRLLSALSLAVVSLASAIPGSDELTARWWDSTAKVTPCTVVIDGEQLVRTKLSILDGSNPRAAQSLSDLLTQADTWMDQGPFTVVAKTQTPPNGTNKDYASQAPYWWPHNWNDTSSNETCPYVQRDGIRNPEVDSYVDKGQGISMFNSSYQLALAWYHTDDVAYRVQAAAVLRTWFVNNVTRMNPSLNHAQIIPCANDGRSIGIIDFSQAFTSVVDAAAILGTVHDKTWSQYDDQAFRQWCEEFLVWLTQSPFGKEENAAENNHGTFAAMQIAAIAAYVGQQDLARSTLEAQKPRIDAFIAANGTKPLELARTRSWHYSTFDLVAYTRMAAIGKHADVNVDLWNYVGPEGQQVHQSILGAIDLLIPYATGEQEWPYPEIGFLRYAASDIIHAAADEGHEQAIAAIGQLEAPPGGDLWYVRPAVEQLDNINVVG